MLETVYQCSECPLHDVSEIILLVDRVLAVIVSFSNNTGTFFFNTYNSNMKFLVDINVIYPYSET